MSVDEREHPFRIRQIALMAAFILFVVSQIVLAVFHEPWRDESQAWLIARDAGPWQVVSDISRQEGHPPLWLFLLMPFAKLGAPYWSMEALSVVIVIVAAAVFMLVEMPAVWKIVMLFTPIFFYWPSVVSRSYCLITLAVALLAYLYPRRERHPWLFSLTIASLFQIHALAFGFAGSFALLQAVEMMRRRRRPWPFLLPAISALAALLELKGADQPVPMNAPVLDRLKMMVVPFTDFLGAPHQTLTLGLIALTVTVVAVLACLNGIGIGLCAFSGIAWLLVMDVLVYPMNSMQKIAAWMSMLMLTVTFSVSKSREQSKRDGEHGVVACQGGTNVLPALIAASIVLALLPAPATFAAARRDLLQPFSSGKELGRLIDDVSSEGVTVVPIEDRGTQYAVSNALPYLTRGQRMWSVATGGEVSYVTNRFRAYWDTHESVADENAPDATAELIDGILPDERNVLIVACTYSDNPALEAAFDSDPRMTKKGSMNEPHVDEALRTSGGIRCAVYSYAH